MAVNKASPSPRPRKGFTGTPKVCKIMALMAVIMGIGLLCYILLGYRANSGLGDIRGPLKGGFREGLDLGPLTGRA